MNYPVYDIEREHKFAVINKNLIDLKNLIGPVYSIENAHHFKEINKIESDLKILAGPVITLKMPTNIMK